MERSDSPAPKCIECARYLSKWEVNYCGACGGIICTYCVLYKRAPSNEKYSVVTLCKKDASARKKENK